MAYFSFSVQAVDKLKVQIDSPYFRLDATRLYLRDKNTIWDSIRRIEGDSNSECKRLRIAVFNGESISASYMGNRYLRMFSREGRAMRWVATSIIPDVYEEL